MAVAANATYDVSVASLRGGFPTFGTAIVAGRPVDISDVGNAVRDVRSREAWSANGLPDVDIDEAAARQAEVFHAYASAVHGTTRHDEVMQLLRDLKDEFKNRMDGMNDRVDGLSARVDGLSAELRADRAKATNYDRCRRLVDTEHLVPIPTVAANALGVPIGTMPGCINSGDPHPVFPSTVGEMRALTTAELDALEVFYGTTFTGRTVTNRRTAFHRFVTGADVRR